MIAASPPALPIPTMTTYCDVAKSPPRASGLTLKIKRHPVTNATLTGTDQQPTAGAFVRELSAASEVCRSLTDTHTYSWPLRTAPTLRRSSSFMSRSSRHGSVTTISPPRSQSVKKVRWYISAAPFPRDDLDCRTDLIAAILKSSEFTQVSKADITGIIEKV